MIPDRIGELIHRVRELGPLRATLPPEEREALRVEDKLAERTKLDFLNPKRLLYHDAMEFTQVGIENERVARRRQALMDVFTRSLEDLSPRTRTILYDRLASKSTKYHQGFQKRRDREELRTKADLYQRAAMRVAETLKVNG